MIYFKSPDVVEYSQNRKIFFFFQNDRLQWCHWNVCISIYMSWFTLCKKQKRASALPKVHFQAALNNRLLFPSGNANIVYLALFITRFARPISICRMFLRDWSCQKASHWWILAQMRWLTEVFMAHGHPWPNQSKWLFSWSQQSGKKVGGWWGSKNNIAYTVFWFRWALGAKSL